MTFCFVDTVSLIIAFIGRYAGVLTGYAGNIVSLIIIIGIYVSILIVGNKYFKQYVELLDVERAGWTVMMVAGIIIYLSMIFFAIYPSPLLYRIQDAPKYLVFCVVVLACYAVFIHSIIKTKKISEQYRQLQNEKKYHRIAYTDTLTALYNRACFVEKLSEYQRKKDELNGLCCVYIDVNKLKKINDTCGHAGGDCALRMVADSLRTVFPSSEDLIFRVGGDEFLVLCKTCSELIENKLSELDLILNSRECVEGLKVSVSAGYDFLNCSSEIEDTIEEAFNRADKKMYAKKNQNSSK